MVAVVRGERSPSPRSKSAPASRAPVAGRARASAARETARPSRQDPDERSGLGPRLALIVGALVILGGAAAALVVARHDRAQTLHAAATAAPAASSPFARLMVPLGFTLQRVEVQGAPDMAKADILRAAALTKGAPILDVDLDGLRKRLEGTGWVKDAKVVRLLPDTLVIAVVPRTPAVVWQHLGVSHVVDGEGKLIEGADPGRFADLPLVVGEGAAEEARNILPLLRQRPALMTRIDALIRVDGRRWDLRLKDGALIQLPALGEDSALIQLDQLDQKQRLRSLGFERVDLRDPDVVAVRPRAPGAAVAATGAN